MAVLGILSTVSMMMFYPPLGMMQAMMPLVGFNKGAGHIHRVRSLVKRVLLITTAMGALFSILVALFPWRGRRYVQQDRSRAGRDGAPGSALVRGCPSPSSD